jgi:RNA polymerase sigma-B factor
MAFDEEERDELRRRFEEFAGSRDPHVRDELVTAHMGLAEYLARRFDNRGEPVEDLVQVACVGLVKAVDRFDPDRGLEFSTFATPTIVGELKRHFRDKGWAVRVPRRIQELHLRLSQVIAALGQDLGRSPTIAEIAREAGASEEEVLEAMEAGHAYRTTSLDAPARGDEPGQSLGDQLGDEDERLTDTEDWLSLSPLLASLPDRERAILHLRFFQGKTQSEIAARVGISQMHVSRLLTRSLTQLRRLAEAADEAELPEADDE